eukprot:c32940_g1_i1.p1 GENE.c32940_g1_i1~~c32940_g1_i1.p1  ORF type:complete len:682 (+),score=172.57 c32940_g1_i1:62-2107(+)
MEIPEHIRLAQEQRAAERAARAEALAAEKAQKEAAREAERQEAEREKKRQKEEADARAKALKQQEAANKAKSAPPPPEPKAPKEKKIGELSSAAAEAKRIEAERNARRAQAKEDKRLRDEEQQLYGEDKNWKIRRLVQSAMDERSPESRDPSHSSATIADRILVCVRVRPLLKKEIDKRDFNILSFSGDQYVALHDVKKNVDLSLRLENFDYRFDFAFDDACSNEDVYRQCLMPMIDSIFMRNQRIAMFAYGQTGSGKTFTMMSIFKQAINDMFIGLHSGELYAHLGLSLSISFYEVYQGKVFDLFASRQALDVMEDASGNINIRGLSETKVATSEDVLELLHKGSKARVSRATEMNDTSSRSHAILSVLLRDANNEEVIHGSLTLIDLAGSEKGSETPGSSKEVRNEAAEINKSLLALKECIRALDDNSSHVPFRGSKLTMILREALIGEQSRAIMVACLAPGYSSSESTLNTLRYAERLKTVGDVPAAVPEEDQLGRLATLNQLRHESTLLTAALQDEPEEEAVVEDEPPPKPTKTNSGIKAKAAPAKPAQVAQKAAPKAATTAVAKPKVAPAAKPVSKPPATKAPPVAVSHAPPPAAVARKSAVDVSEILAMNLEAWMLSIGLSEDSAHQYASALKEEGFDDVESLHDTTEEELVKLCQMKVGHVRKVMRHFGELNGN